VVPEAHLISWTMRAPGSCSVLEKGIVQPAAQYVGNEGGLARLTLRAKPVISFMGLSLLLGCYCATRHHLCSMKGDLILSGFFLPKQNSSPTRAAAARRPPRKPSRRQRGHGETLHVCRDARRSPPVSARAARLQQGNSVSAAVPLPCGHERAQPPCPGFSTLRPPLRRGLLACRGPASSVIGRARAPARRKVCARARCPVPERISDPVNRSDYTTWPSLIRCLTACVRRACLGLPIQSGAPMPDASPALLPLTLRPKRQQPVAAMAAHLTPALDLSPFTAAGVRPRP